MVTASEPEYQQQHQHRLAHNYPDVACPVAVHKYIPRGVWRHVTTWDISKKTYIGRGVWRHVWRHATTVRKHIGRGACIRLGYEVIYWPGCMKIYIHRPGKMPVYEDMYAGMYEDMFAGVYEDMYTGVCTQECMKTCTQACVKTCFNKVRKNLKLWILTGMINNKKTMILITREH